MVVRVLLVLAVFAVFYGCGQASSPVEKQEKQGGVEQAEPAETTTEAVGNMPIAGIIGESVEGGSYDFRVLDYFVTDHYYYNGGLFEEEDAFSQLGKFIVVNYSLTNTSAETISPNFNAYLHARAGGGNVEVYDPHQEIVPPHAVLSPSPVSLDDLPPRQMFVSQFIFDVPRDVEAELLVVEEIYTLADPPNEVGVMDLTRNDPQGPEPQEVLALQLEYENMRAWEPSYDLYDQGSRDRVSLEQYKAALKRDPVSTTKYSFPRVDVRGDRATLETVLAFEYEDGTEDQLRTTLEAVQEDVGWRMVMRPEQYEFFLGGQETTQ